MQHTTHFWVHEHEKFKNAIQINRSHSRISRKTYDAAQCHDLIGLLPQSDYLCNSETSTSSTCYAQNIARRKTLCQFIEQQRTWWKSNPKSTTSTTTQRLINTGRWDQERRPRIEELALQLHRKMKNRDIKDKVPTSQLVLLQVWARK